MVRRSWPTQLSLPRALPSLLGLTTSPPCCSQPLSRPTSCLSFEPTLLPTASCWRCSARCPRAAWSVCGMQNNKNANHFLKMRFMKYFHVHYLKS